MLIPLKVMSVVAAFVSDSSIALSVNISSWFSFLLGYPSILLLSIFYEDDEELMDELLEEPLEELLEELEGFDELLELDALEEFEELDELLEPEELATC